jgi:hypothetical protein
MRLTVAALSLLAPGFALAAPVDPAVMAPIVELAEGFNTGSPARITAAHAPAPVIVDEFAPYLWSGDQAVASWGAAYGAYAGGKGLTGGSVTLGEPTFAEVTGVAAYVISPSVIVETSKAGSEKHTGTFAFTLVKLADGWRIKSWSYARGQVVK